MVDRTKSRIVGILLVAGGLLEKGLDWLVRLGGIHADTPGLFDSVIGLMSQVFEFLGLSGIAIIIGAAFLAWSVWSDSLRTWFGFGVGGQVASRRDPKEEHESGESSSSDDISVQLHELNRQQERILANIDELNGDILVTLEYLEFEVTASIVSVVRSNVPQRLEERSDFSEVKSAWISEQTQLANEYVSFVSAELKDTELMDGLQLVIQHAEEDGNRRVADIQHERRPLSSIDGNAFRLYGVAMTKNAAIKEFLRYQEQRLNGLRRYHLAQIYKRRSRYFDSLT